MPTNIQLQLLTQKRFNYDPNWHVIIEIVNKLQMLKSSKEDINQVRGFNERTCNTQSQENAPVRQKVSTLVPNFFSLQKYFY